MTNVVQYPSEIHRLLKIGDADPMISGPLRRVEDEASVPEGLPVKRESLSEVPLPPAKQLSQQTQAIVDSNTTDFNSLDIIKERPSRIKQFLVYPVVFIGAFVFFYVLLNFPSILAQVQGYFTKPQAAVQLGSQTTEYYNWIDQYYFSVNDPKLLDPNNDIDKDGLTNMEEFIMRTNPIVADSDRDSFPDGLEVITNHNSWGAGTMTEIQKKLAASIDTNVIANRIAYYAAASTQTAHGTVSGAVTYKYDLNKPGKLSIPRLNIQVPLIWSKDPANFETDLSHGVIHYPGTALPGEQGTVYVSGHSSDYIWKKDPYAQIFTKINYLQPGDDVFVEVYGIDDKTYNYRYQVVGSNIYKPDDQIQFIDNSTNKINLSTCWPIGTQQSRIVVSAVQIGL